MFKSLNWRGQAHAFSNHFHSEFFMSVTLQGECRFTCEGKDYVAAPGQLSIIPPFHVHAASCASNVAYSAVYLSAIWMKKHMKDYDESVRLQWVSPCVVSDLLLADSLALAMHRGCAERVSRVAAEVVGKYARRVEADSNPISWRQAALYWMNKAVVDQLPISSVAKAMGMSLQGFSRAFARHFGMAPVFFKRQLRMEAAESLLLSGEKPIQVAAQCGFADQAHLSRELKAARGTTPRQYIKYYRSHS